MTPRLLTRTHYQIDELAYLRALVLRCTSPTRSEYRERVAAQLVSNARDCGNNINVAAAGYAIDLGRATGLINSNNVWTDRAHLLNLIAKTDQRPGPELSAKEQIFFFHLLLASDGAAMIYFLRELKTRGRLPDVKDWNVIANDLFLWALRQYYELTTDLAQRTHLRQLIHNRQAKPFSGRSGEHQCYIHLQSLYRLGLVGKIAGEGTRTYVLLDSSSDGSVIDVLAELNDIEALERAVKDRLWVKYANRIYSPIAHGSSHFRTKCAQYMVESLPQECPFALCLH